jgi:hypothetical protein
MASSGTYTFSLTIDDLINEGCERAGVEPGSLASQQLIGVIRSINLALIEFENMGQSIYRLDSFDISLLNNIRGYQLPDGTIDVIDGYIRDSNNDDRKLARISRSDYFEYPAKDTKSEPYSFFVSYDVSDTAYTTSISSDLTEPSELDAAFTPNAAAAQPILVFYPCPNQDSEWVFVGNRIRTHQDASSMNQHVDLNRQWYDAICANVAQRIAEKHNQGLFDQKKLLAIEAKNSARLETG